jgi:hypothetical protein
LTQEAPRGLRHAPVLELPTAPPPPETPQSPPATSPLPAWAVFLIVGTSALLFIAIGSGLQLVNLGVGLLCTEVCLFLGLPWALTALRRESPVLSARAHWPGWKPLGWGLALGAVNYFGAVVPLQFLSQSVFPQSMVELFDMSHILVRQDPVDLALILLAVSVAAPLCEEYFFRGFFQERLQQALGRPERALAIVAVVFSAFHLDPVGFLARVELGVLFGLLYWRMGSLWPGVMAHAANNIVSSGLFLLARSAGTTDEEVSGMAVLVMAAIGLTILAFLLRAALRTQVPPPPPRAPAARPSVHAIWPWPAFGFVAVMAVLALDLRGARLNVVDAQVRLAPEPSEPSPEETRLRDELFELRQRARRGEETIEAYEEARREAAQQLELRPES